MAHRAVVRAALALLIAVPVAATSPSIAAADAPPTVGLTVHSSSTSGGPYSTGFELAQGVTFVDSAPLTDSSPDATLSNVLTPGGVYQLGVGVPPSYYVSSLTCDVATTSLGDGMIEFTVPADATAVVCDVVWADLINVHIEKTTDGADGTFGFHVDGTDGNHSTSITTHSFFGSADIGVRPGTYAFSETPVAGWEQTAIECGDMYNNPVDPAAMTIQAGNTYWCAVTNTSFVPLEMDLQWVGDALPSAEVTGSWAPDTAIQLTTGQIHNGYLPVGTWTITPTPIDGYDPYIACTVFHQNAPYENIEGGTSITITVNHGDELACGVSHDQLPTLIINKAVDKDTTDRTFTFSTPTGASADVVASTPSDGNGTQAVLPLQVGSQIITESGAAGWNLTDATCVDQNESDMQVTVLPNGRFAIDFIYYAQVIECDLVNSGAVTVDKTGVSFLPTDTPGRYEATWDVTVTNGTDTDADNLLLDDPVGLVSGSSLVEATAVDPNGEPVLGWDGWGNTVLGSGISVPAGQSKTWTLSVVIDLPPNLDSELLNCPVSEATGNGGVQNIVAVVQVQPDDSHVTLDDDWACMDIPAPDITIDKTLDGPIVDNHDGTYTQSYIVTVTNEGNGYGTFDAIDHAGFGDGFIIESATFSNSEGVGTVDGWDGLMLLYDNQALGSGESVSTTIDVVFSIDPSVQFSDQPADWKCSTDSQTGEFVPGSGLYNDAVLVHGDDAWVTVTACADGPATDIVVDKAVAGYEYVGNDTIVVDFDITASNDPDAGQPGFGGLYAIEDSGANNAYGVQVTDFQLLSVDGGTEDVDYGVSLSEGGFGAEGYLAPGDTHVYHVRVTYVVSVYDGFNGTCFDGNFNPENPPPGGAANFILWAQVVGSAGVPTGTNKVTALTGSDPSKQVVFPPDTSPFPAYIHVAYDCVDLSAVWIDKTVTNDDGGKALPGSFDFEVRRPDGEVERTVTQGEPYLLATGDYAVVEIEDPDYIASEFACDAFDLNTGAGGKPNAARPTYRELGVPARPEATVSLPGYIVIEMQSSYGYSCEITNDDRPADLGITKSDGDTTAVAGGAPITYTFVIANYAGFLDTAATFNDTLPTGWTWVPGSVTGCASPALTATTFTCEVPAGELGSSGDFVTITAQARLAADAPSGDYVNLATVSSAGDPAPASPVCPSSAPANAKPAELVGPNVACDTTPAIRQATMSATKVATTTAPVPVGGTVGFTLTVTNHGPSTLLSGTQMTDDLPAGLTIVSVSAPGWTCNAADPVICVLNDGIGVDGTPSPIVVTTRIATGATGTIVNSASFTGIVDAEESGTGTSLTGHRRSEAVIVTVTAEATATATVSVASGGRTLPGTGNQLLPPLMWAGWLTALGLTGLVLARRRRRLA